MRSVRAVADRSRASPTRVAARGGGFFVDVGANVGHVHDLDSRVRRREIVALRVGCRHLRPAVGERRPRRLSVRRPSRPPPATAAPPGSPRAGTRASCSNPDGRVEARLVTIDSLIGQRHVAGMKVDVEGFEIRRAPGLYPRAVRMPHRTDPARMERDRNWRSEPTGAL